MLFHTNIIQSADNQIRVVKFKKNFSNTQHVDCRIFPHYSTLIRVENYVVTQTINFFVKFAKKENYRESLNFKTSYT